MAKYRFQGALNAAVFPFVSSFQGRSVVQPQLDNNVKTNQSFYGTQESADYSIPQLLYCENVVPTAEGIMTCGYDEVIAATADNDFDQVITLRDADENNFLLSPANGKNYIYTGNAAAWISTNPIDAAGRSVSRAYVNGRTLICYEGLGIYEYDSVAMTFLPVIIVGLAAADIRGIGASNNYLIAYTDITVHWSSLIDPLDFVPSITTGAGFAIPQDVKAKINAVIGTAGGFIIYTAKNAVAAVYTQNTRAPFNFKEIANAGGIESYEQVTSDQNSGPQYAWGTGGFQKITTQNSEPLAGELNDFLAGKVYEEWDPVNKRLTTTRSGSVEFQVKVTYIASRYLIISYSLTRDGIYQYALLYDTALKRWGKLKFTHVDCFQYPYPNVFGNLTYDDLSATTYDALGETSYADLSEGLLSQQPSKRTVGFLGTNGQVHILEMDYNKSDQRGVMIFGKFQLTRARLMTIQRLDLEAIFGTDDVEVTAIASLDGKDMAFAKPMMELLQGEQIHKYARRLTGINISIAIEGALSATSYLLEVTNDGDR
jgi:hypothetical protein